MLPRQYRLTSNNDFQTIYKNGRKVRGTYGMLIGLKADVPHPQFGFVVKKKIGNAVKRHKMTKRLRHIIIDSIKELQIDDLSMKFQYIAFEYTDDFAKLTEEFKSQLKEHTDEVANA